MRSIPEKTLEHWASIYLANRFPNASLWWPTSGEDVLVDDLRSLAATGNGFTLALELKTTEPINSAEHFLTVDVDQLRRYLWAEHPPIPVYYVFPLPYWAGSLSPRRQLPASPKGITAAASEMWRRSSDWHWFGEWIHVLSAKSVWRHMTPRQRNQRAARILKLNHIAAQQWPPVPWADLLPQSQAGVPVPTLWKDFWDNFMPTRSAAGRSALEGIRWYNSAHVPGVIDLQVVDGGPDITESDLDERERDYLADASSTGRRPRPTGERIAVHIPDTQRGRL